MKGKSVALVVAFFITFANSRSILDPDENLDTISEDEYLMPDTEDIRIAMTEVLMGALQEEIGEIQTELNDDVYVIKLNPRLFRLILS